ncbi:amino acid adenylation domain-containing protein, partial [Fulvivirga kasyanovii]|uniref:non-ribosomal peptide synthetase n=1 Tax=Fulvivirga kasyanovii TaxID=396812 RepID=UPI0031D4437D
QALYALDYLSAAEKQELLKDFNATASEYPSATVPELFSARAAAHPDSVAVVYQDRELTYGELEARSNQLAHYLQATYDIGRDDLVGLMVDRSEWLMVGILGILKAGGAYVPLDPAYPRQRIDYIIEDSGMNLLLTNPQYVFEGAGTAQAALERLPLDQWPVTPVSTDRQPGDLIYGLYTSGSTGKPKGVQVEDHSVVNLSQWLSELIYSGEPKPLTALLTASVTFDASVQQLFAPLLNGGRLVLIAEEIKKDVNRYIEQVWAHQVDVLDITPAYLHAVLNELAAKGEVLPVKYTLVGGEALAEEDGLRYQAYFTAGSRLYNVYGLTETTVDSTCELVDATRQPHSIGKPLNNTQLYILDSHGQLAPVGVPGEICIGGAGVSRGYLNKPELTQERFKANPYGSGRLYHTGDTGRWRPDGSIEYTGRKDHQVKIRGYRIELGEIE